MMHRLSLESAAIVAALFAALLVAPDHTVAQQSTITLNPAGAPAGTTVTVSSPLQIGICPMYILELSVMWDEPQQMVGQVQGNPCSGWNGTFTVPRDAAPGVHHLSVSPTPGGTVELGTFIVTQSPAPPPEGTPTPTDQAPQPTIYRVRDSGIRCVAAPCPSYEASIVNIIDSMILPTIFDTPNRFTLSGVDLSNVPATPEQLATAARALSEDSLLVAGTIQRQPNAGPAGDGRVLVATQFYLPATPADGQR